MFGAYEELDRFLNGWGLQLGDVTYTRRWFRREWFIVTEKNGANVSGPCIFARSRKYAGHTFDLSRTTVCNDPNKWPDEVCAPAAAWRLTNG